MTCNLSQNNTNKKIDAENVENASKESLAGYQHELNNQVFPLPLTLYFRNLISIQSYETNATDHHHYFHKQNVEVSEPKTAGTAQKEYESNKVMEANDRELMKLMRKDYKGMNKARRKPPINNNKPTN